MKKASTITWRMIWCLNSSKKWSQDQWNWLLGNHTGSSDSYDSGHFENARNENENAIFMPCHISFVKSLTIKLLLLEQQSIWLSLLTVVTTIAIDDYIQWHAHGSVRKPILPQQKQFSPTRSTGHRDCPRSSHPCSILCCWKARHAWDGGKRRQDSSATAAFLWPNEPTGLVSDTNSPRNVNRARFGGLIFKKFLYLFQAIILRKKTRLWHKFEIDLNIELLIRLLS